MESWKGDKKDMKKRIIAALMAGVLMISLTGCQKSTPKPGSIAGYDKGEQYLSIWVHSIEDTDEGRCYREAVNAFNKELLANHIRTCVARDIREGKDETIDELVTTLQKLMK